MRRRRLRAAAAGLLALAAPAAAGPAGAGKTGTDEGLYCTMAIVSVAAEVERRCPGKADPALRAALEESLRLMEARVIASGAGDSASLARFRREQGGVGADDATLCAGDGAMLYEAIRKAGGAALVAGTRRLVSRPGKPGWGDCF